jgi:hypothetical protein
MTDQVKRRLTTVLGADVHGYSRLMETDEAGTSATLRRYRSAMAGGAASDVPRRYSLVPCHGIGESIAPTDG